MTELSFFQREVGMWADRNFPQSTSQSICDHLIEEATEVDDAVDERAGHTHADIAVEAADCLLLLLHLAHKEGFDLVAATRAKFQRNQQRTWESDDHGRGYWKHTEEGVMQ
jgi:NTP pyrophosphatase (non-canonical NTP hydrolase)